MEKKPPEGRLRSLQLQSDSLHSHLCDVQQAVLHECVDCTERDAKHSELSALERQEWLYNESLASLNLGSSCRIVVNCKTVCLSIIVDDGNLDDIASMHGHYWPRPLLMIHAVVEPIDVGNDGEISSCAADPRARRTGETNGERHDSAPQCSCHYDGNDCEQLVLQQ